MNFKDQIYTNCTSNKNSQTKLQHQQQNKVPKLNLTTKKLDLS